VLKAHVERLCGLVVRVPDYGFRGPRFHSRRYQIFGEALGLERGPLSLLRIIEERLECENNDTGLENRSYRPWGSVVLIKRDPSTRKFGTAPTNGG
jgi:hypothetical protein